jgi:uncharacterized RDD family membrane protein YckC
MAITFSCGGCQQPYKVDEALAGRKIRCKKCSAVVSIPVATATTPGGQPRSGLQSFGGNGSNARSRPTLQTFGSPATPPRPAPRPEPAVNRFIIEDDYEDAVEIGDDPVGIGDDRDDSGGPADPYSLDEAYLPPRAAAAAVEEELPGPRRAGKPRKESRRVELAGFGGRLVAQIIDGFVAVGLLIAFIIVGAAIIAVMGPKPNDPTPILVIMAMYGFGIVAILAYNVITIGSSWQATLGKLAIGIKVTDLDGRPLSFGRSLGRELSKFFITGMIPLAIGFLMALFTERKQALHDMIAGTLVVKAR